MTEMDDVFANSSSDTVVVPPDFSIIIDNFTQEAKELQEILDKQENSCEKKDGRTSCRDPREKSVAMTSSQMKTFGLSESSFVTPNQSPAKKGLHFQLESPAEKVAHVSVITSVKSQCDLLGNKDVSNHVFKFPDNPAAAASYLRHTQSAVQTSAAGNVDVRPRAHSHNSQYVKKTPSPIHQYVNLLDVYHIDATTVSSNLSKSFNMEPPSPKITYPAYMNVPFPQSMYAKSISSSMLPPMARLSGSNSAPSTPKGSDNKPTNSNSHLSLNHSYLQIWADIKPEKDTLSEGECEEVKKYSSVSSSKAMKPSKQRASGYVEMSSPYIRSPKVNTAITDLATNLASYVGHALRDVFCPFCPRYFSYESSLSNHIQKAHNDELNKFLHNQNNETIYQYCPICQARFFNLSVLPKHLIECHQQSIVRLLVKYEFLTCNNFGLHCPFCNKRVPNSATGDNVLIYHMHNVHKEKLEKLLEEKFKPYFSGCKKNIKLSGSDNKNEQVSATPGLSDKLCVLSVDKAKKNTASQASAISTDVHTKNARKYSSSSYGDDVIVSGKGILRNETSVQRKASVKRELRFSVPPVTSEEIYTPESPEQNGNLVRQSNDNLTTLHNDDVTTLHNGETIPVRIDSLGSADFIELTDNSSRKRRRLGAGFKSKMFKRKDKENVNINDYKDKENRIPDQSNAKTTGKKVVATSATRTFRKPKPIPTPQVPTISLPIQNPKHAPMEAELKDNYSNNRIQGEATSTAAPGTTSLIATEDANGLEKCPFTNVKLFSPLRMFRCNGCRIKFCDNESLSNHINQKHKGFFGFLRPHYGCGVCSAKFYENKYLVKHCLQHHTSLLEIRSPKMHKITIYRFSQD